MIGSIEIILIEDNFEDAELTIPALKKRNLANNLVHLKDGEEALDFLFAKRHYANRDILNAPEIILLDLNMPKINGLEVLAKIREDERTRKIPVFVLTSSKENPDVDRCYQLGVNGYIVKPVNFDNFSEAIFQLGYYWLLLNHQPGEVNASV